MQAPLAGRVHGQCFMGRISSWPVVSSLASLDLLHASRMLQALHARLLDRELRLVWHVHQATSIGQHAQA